MKTGRKRGGLQEEEGEVFGAWNKNSGLRKAAGRERRKGSMSEMEEGGVNHYAFSSHTGISEKSWWEKKKKAGDEGGKSICGRPL